MQEQSRRHVEQQQQLRQEMTRLAADVAGTLCEPAELPELVIVVPHLDAEEQPLDHERRAAFLARLSESISEAEKLTRLPEKADCLNREYATRTEAVASLPVINACSTCRGRCCRNGRDHAFLIPEFLAWRLLNDRGMTAESLQHQHAELIPERSISESCVFHTRHGCVLPHPLRGSTCHDFFCTNLLDFPHAIRSTEMLASVCLSADGDTFTRLGNMSADGQRTEVKITSPPGM